MPTETPNYALIARLQGINPALDATVALLAAAQGDFRLLLEFGFELAPHPFGVTLYHGGLGAVVTTPPNMSKVEAAVLSLTNSRKPVETGLGSAIDEAVPLYLPEPLTPEAAAYAAAYLPDRLRRYAATLVLKGHHEQGEFTTLIREAADKLETAAALLNLSARYREAHAGYKAALATSEAAFAKRPIVSAKTWERLEGEFKAAESAMEAAKQALLAAALDIT